MSTVAVPPRAAHLDALLADAAVVAQRARRDDLSTRIEQLRERVADPTVRVVVIGQFKQGKSALVNALVNAPVCPVDDVVGTAVPTLVGYSKQANATMFRAVDGVDGLQTKSLDVERLRDHVTETATEHEGIRPIRVEVNLSRRILSDGLVLVDTPGVGGTTASHAAATLAMLPTADAVLMISDASQEFTDPELAFLKQAAKLCPTITCVLTKTDPHPHWRDIAETNVRHLESAGVKAPLIPVSSHLHQLALRTQDAALDEESGIPELQRMLRRDVVDRVVEQKGHAVAHQVLSLVDHLSLAIESELQTLRRPTEGAAVVQTLEEAQEAARKLSAKTAKWQQTLGDGSADLTNDVEYDLRDRLRTVGREADILIDDCDPGEQWEEIGAWLADAISQAVGDNFVWAHQRSEWLAARVAEHFAIEGAVDLPQFRLTDTASALDPIAGLEPIDSGAMSLPQKLLTGMRNSYGGILMFGLLTSLAGMALVNPISIAAGFVIGGYAYKTEVAQRLKNRRNMAKTAVRRLIDEAIFQLGKESRDRVMEAKRTLRDHFEQVARNVKRSLEEAIESAKAGAGRPDSERSLRIADLEQRERELLVLVDRARALLPPDREHQNTKVAS